MLPSTDTTHIPSARGVFGCYFSSMIPGLWGLQLTLSDLAQINFGLLSCLVCDTLAQFASVVSFNQGLLGLFTLHCSAESHHLYGFCHYCCHCYPHYYCFVSYMCPGSCTCAYMDCKKYHSFLLVQCPRT